MLIRPKLVQKASKSGYVTTLNSDSVALVKEIAVKKYYVPPPRKLKPQPYQGASFRTKRRLRPSRSVTHPSFVGIKVLVAYYNAKTKEERNVLIADVLALPKSSVTRGLAFIASKFKDDQEVSSRLVMIRREIALGYIKPPNKYKTKRLKDFQSKAKRPKAFSASSGNSGKVPPVLPGESGWEEDGDASQENSDVQALRTSVMRYLTGELPTASVLDDATLLKIRVARQPGTASFQPFSIDLPEHGVILDVAVVAPDFEIDRSPSGELKVPREDDSDVILFILTPKRLGTLEVKLVLTHQGRFVSGLTLTTHVTKSRDGTGEVSSYEWPIRINVGDSYPQATLSVSFNGDINKYLFQLFDPFRGTKPIFEVRDYASHSKFIADLIKTLDQLVASESRMTPTQKDTKLKGLGKQIWKDLIPKELQQRLCRVLQTCSTLTILCDNDSIPWELAFVADLEQSTGKYLGEAIHVARMLFDVDMLERGNIVVDNAVFVSTEAGPSRTADEIAALSTLFETEHVQFHQRPNSPDELIEIIHEGSFDLMHFACHILPALGADNQKIPWGKNGESSFTVPELTGASENFAKRQLVFMNACRSASNPSTHLGINTWASNFVTHGASTFIGTLWSVRDETAARFANIFYTALTIGESVGEALKTAREAVRASGDPTWIAYVLYGNPDNKVGFRGAG